MSVKSVAVLVFFIFSTRTGEQLSVDALADELAGSDVVFLGEEHDNTAGHELELQIVQALHARRGDLVVSMEMFERDVQGVLDDYLRGRIDEATFREHARPPKNYEKAYRPIVEYARQQGLEMIAANAPTSTARRICADGLQGVADRSFLARSITAPHDRYWHAFAKAMADHPGGGLSGDALDRFYQAQCAKDDTMAEAIMDFRRSHPHRQPLIVQICGNFHSDMGRGTVSRVLARDPLCRVSVVTMEPAADPAKVEAKKLSERAHYVLAVPEEPKKERPKEEEPAAAATEEMEDEGKEVAAAGKEKAGKKEEKKEADEPHERSALGIMPSYEEDPEPGVMIDQVTPGKGAEAAGILDGDRILMLGGERVLDLADYMDVMSLFHPGQVIKVKVRRGKKELTLDVKLGAYGR